MAVGIMIIFSSLVNDAMDETAEMILRAVDEVVSDFVGDAEQFDSLTMLCIEYSRKRGLIIP